ISISERRKADTYNASVRELADIAKVSKETVSTANKRLKRLGFIEEIRQLRSGRKPKIFRLFLDHDSFRTYTTHGVGCGKCPDIVADSEIINHELFSHKRFGRTSGVLYSFLMLQPMSTKELEEASGVTSRTIQRRLKILTEVMAKDGELFELVQNRSGLWHAV